jgi:hypothetical protein
MKSGNPPTETDQATWKKRTSKETAAAQQPKDQARQILNTSSRARKPRQMKFYLTSQEQQSHYHIQ